MVLRKRRRDKNKDLSSINNNNCKRPLKLIFFLPLCILIVERIWIPLDLSSSVIHNSSSSSSLSSLPSPSKNDNGGSKDLFSKQDFMSRKITSIIGNNKNNNKNNDDNSNVVDDKTTMTTFKKYTIDNPPPLQHLTTETIPSTCDNEKGLYYLEDKHLPQLSSTIMNNKIPKIIHQTAKSRCVTQKFLELTNEWKTELKDHSYYFHDDNAMLRLLQQIDFSDYFPHLETIWKYCVTNGTLKADLWRYLALYVYGGIYADFDSKPNKFSSTTIVDSHDGFFVVEQYHVLSQWFMAVSPKHPLMYYTIQHALLNLLQAKDTKQIGAQIKTGPHALHKGFIDFRRDVGVQVDSIGTGMKPVWNGTFVGTFNRSITVVGVGENENEYIQRLAMGPAIRKRDYRLMNMTHFQMYTKQFGGKPSGMTCLSTILDATSTATTTTSTTTT